MMKTTRALVTLGMAALLLASGAQIAAEPSATARFDWLFNRFLSSTTRIGNTLYSLFERKLSPKTFTS